MAMLPKLLVTGALALGVATGSGCGDDTPLGEAPARGSSTSIQATSAPVAWFVFDVTTSFEDAAPACVPDMVPVAKWVAERHGRVYAGPFMTGDPQSQPWKVEERFDKASPAALDGNDELERSWRARQAERLEPRLLDIATSEPQRGGSPVLKMLLRTADFRGQHARGGAFIAVICSDLAAFGDRLDVTKPISDDRIDAVFQEWQGTFENLAGADIYFIGVGRSDADVKIDPESLAKVKQLVRDLLADAGAHVRLMDTQLGSAFPPVTAAEG